MSDNGESPRPTRRRCGRKVQSPQKRDPEASNQMTRLVNKRVQYNAQDDSSDAGPKRPKNVSKMKHDDGVTPTGPGHVAADGRDEKVRDDELKGPKQCKTEQVECQVKAKKDAKKTASNMKPVASAKASSCAKIPSGIAAPSKHPSSPGALSYQLSQFEMNVMDKLKNVADINEFLKDQLTVHTTSKSSSSAPAMISEGAGGKFQIINFYWLDMYEDPKNPGVLYIFGKVKAPPPGNGYSSCCVVVKNLERRIFLLPREKADKTRASYMDMYNEFYSVISPKYKITSFASKRTTKKYCFGIKGIPPVAEYMEVRYSGVLPVLPKDLNGQTFSHAFGTNTSLTETFLLEKKFKEPCWLQILLCQQVQPDEQKTWCKFEFTCDVASVEVHPDCSSLQPPTLVVVSLTINEVYDEARRKSSIILAGLAVNQNVELKSTLRQNEILQDFFCLLHEPPGQSWPLDVDRVTNERILKMDSEQSLLECLLTKLHELDPDVYLGKENYFKALLRELSLLKMPHRSRIGRLKRLAPITQPNKHDFDNRDVRVAFTGQLLCDVTGLAREIIPAQLSKLCNNVDTLCTEFLGVKDYEVPLLSTCEKTFLFQSFEGLRLLVNCDMQHCVLSIRMMNKLELLPLALHVASITGTPLSQILSAYGFEQFEYLLLHAFNVKGYILPDKFNPPSYDVVKYAENENEGDKKVQLTSKGGFYESFVVNFLLNFQSVFLCAIQDLTALSSDEDRDDSNRAEEEPQRTIQEEIRGLKKSLQNVMSLIEGKGVTEDQKRHYEIQQKALRWAISSMYESWLNYCRFDTEGLEKSVKAKAHDVLLKMKESIGRMGFELIYCTEDTVMINTNSKDYSSALEMRKKVQDELKRTYPFLKVLRVFMYRFTLVLNNYEYAGRNHITTGTSIGAGVVQQLSREAPIAYYTSGKCLQEILSGQPLYDKVYKVGKILWDMSTKLKNGTVALDQLFIKKKLTKDPENCKQVEALDHAHVAVALRMNKKGTLPKKFRKGDQLSYLYCTDGQPHHLSEMDKDDENGLKVDFNYYLARVLHPIVRDICKPIPELGFTSARVADALGLDSSQYERP